MPVATKKHVARDEVVGGQDAVEVVAGVEGLLPLVVVLGPEPALDHAADALDGAGGDDALRRAADAEQQVDTGARAGGHDRAGDVAVGDVADARAGVADLLGELLVARPVEDDDRDVGGSLLLGLGDAPDVLGDGQADVDDVGGLGAGGELVHVEDGGGVVHRPAVGDGHDGDGVVHALGRQRRAVDGVDGDVDLGAGAVADLLAVVEHRGVVLLALADDDDAVHADRGDHRAHRLDRGAVGLVLLAAADPPASGHRRCLGHPDQLEGEVAVGLAVLHRVLRRLSALSRVGASLAGAGAGLDVRPASGTMGS